MEEILRHLAGEGPDAAGRAAAAGAGPAARPGARRRRGDGGRRASGPRVGTSGSRPSHSRSISTRTRRIAIDERARRAAGLLALALLTGWTAYPTGSAPERLRALYSGPVSTWPAANIDDGIDFVEFGALKLKPVPDAGKAALGRRLFHDPTLSRTGDKACASCHDANHGWSDGRPIAVGMDPARGARNVPSLFSVAYRRQWGWDGRGSSLAAQSLRPLTHPDEMANADVESVVSRLGERRLPVVVRRNLWRPGDHGRSRLPMRCRRSRPDWRSRRASTPSCAATPHA